MLYWSTAGESHGCALIAFIEGLPAGINLTSDLIGVDLARRRLGYGRGARMNFERDIVRIISGVRWGKTLGGPIAIEISNTEWPKWEQVMSVDPVDEETVSHLARGAALTRPRPGHADLVGMLKYGFDDARPVLERASARETAARVAAGVAAKQFLSALSDAHVYSHIISIGAAPDYQGPPPAYTDLPAIDDSPVRVFDRASEVAMIAEIESAKKDGDTLGGIFEVIADNIPLGLGSFTSAQRKLSSKLAAAIMSINAIKGVEIGDGFLSARTRGSLAHDEIIGAPRKVARATNRSGGIEGGMTNGQLIRVRGAMKPISTVPRALRTVDLATGEPAQAIHQRSDICAVPAAAVVGEAMVALVLAEAALEKFGGDHIEHTKKNLESYEHEITERTRHIRYNQDNNGIDSIHKHSAVK